MENSEVIPEIRIFYNQSLLELRVNSSQQETDFGFEEAVSG